MNPTDVLTSIPAAAPPGCARSVAPLTRPEDTANCERRVLRAHAGGAGRGAISTKNDCIYATRAA
jgi:hypothetical protein